MAYRAWSRTVLVSNRYFQHLQIAPIVTALTLPWYTPASAANANLRYTTRYRFSTETLTAARAVGLVVGRFAKWDVPQAPRVKGLVLRASSAVGGGRGRGGHAKVRCGAPGEGKGREGNAVQ